MERPASRYYPPGVEPPEPQEDEEDEDGNVREAQKITVGKEIKLHRGSGARPGTSGKAPARGLQKAHQRWGCRGAYVSLTRSRR